MSLVRYILPAVTVAIFLTTGCMKWDYTDEVEDFDATGNGLFICNEGNFQYSNATLSYYDPASGSVSNEVFFRANGYRLGDVVQSMTIHDGKGWIVMNNSNVIWAIDLDTFKEKGRIENLASPRYIHFITDEKAYVSQIWSNSITIVNPETFGITGHIRVPGMASESGSTEQMVQSGKYVFCNCWSYQNCIIKIDTETDCVVDRLDVGIQPKYLVLDRYNKLWTLTDGGYEGSPYGNEAPVLVRINPDTFMIEKIFRFGSDDDTGMLQINAGGDTLYWINDDVWRMDVKSERLPVRPFIKSMDTKYFGLTLDPSNGDVYVADAIDYQQQGIVYRYTASGDLIESFYVGINPGAFCWK